MRTRRSWRNQDRLFRELGKEKGVCIWHQDEDGDWHTGCDNIYIILAGTPKENGMKFCCYCGNPLRQRGFRAALEEEV